jgi:hypothetical protein
MTENEIIEVISNSHLGELYSELKEVYEKNKHKVLINIDDELILDTENKVRYIIITGSEHSDIVDEAFEKINECIDGQFPKGLPTGSGVYFSNKKRNSGRTLVSIIVELKIDGFSVSFYFGYVKQPTN